MIHFNIIRRFFHIYMHYIHENILLKTQSFRKIIEASYFYSMLQKWR